MIEETLKEGEWIVHKQYGIGQIKGIEKKHIGGETRKYFRVKISDGVYWLPAKEIPAYIRFVSSKYKLFKALKALRRAPEILPKNYKVRNSEVAERADKATLQAMGELIRDLHARKFLEGANTSIVDDRQLTGFRQQFIREMSVILDIDIKESEEKLDKALELSVEKLPKAK